MIRSPTWRSSTRREAWDDVLDLGEFQRTGHVASSIQEVHSARGTVAIGIDRFTDNLEAAKTTKIHRIEVAEACVTGATVNGIACADILEHIAVCAAFQNIVAFATRDGVIAVATLDGVVAGATDQAVIAVLAADEVVIDAAINGIVADTGVAP
jgi:hypothetical protein